MEEWRREVARAGAGWGCGISLATEEEKIRREGGKRRRF
jgi:hypothetical protein